MEALEERLATRGGDEEETERLVGEEKKTLDALHALLRDAQEVFNAVVAL